jgi:hypothetical protein
VQYEPVGNTAAERRRHRLLHGPNGTYRSFVRDCEDPLTDILPHRLGVMDEACMHCGAMHWKVERASGSPGLYSVCCQRGSVDLPHIQDPPPPLKRLMQLPAFRNQLRSYNAAFQMATSSADVASFSAGVSQFRVKSTIYHSVRPLLPKPAVPATATARAKPAATPRHMQLFILGPEAATEERMWIHQTVQERHAAADARAAAKVAAAAAAAAAGDEEDYDDHTAGHSAATAPAGPPDQQRQTLTDLHNMFVRVNPHIKMFRTAAQEAVEAQAAGRVIPELHVAINVQGVPDIRRFNAPTGVAEVAGFIPDVQAS